MAKVKTIKLVYPCLNPDPKLDLQSATEDQRYVYRIVQITDSVDFAPNSYIFKSIVDTLCKSDEWKVTIVPN